MCEAENLDQALLSLAQKGWIEYNENAGSFKCNPLVQEIIRHKNQTRLFADCEKMIDFLIEELHPDNTHKENYKYATLYSSYAESILANLSGLEDLTGLYPLSILAERIGVFHQTTGNLSKALDFYKKQNDMAEKLVAQNPTNVSFKNGLAISYAKFRFNASQFGQFGQGIGIF